MESKKRAVSKAVSWQVVGLFVTSLLGYLITGSFTEGGAMAIASCISGFILYILHERAWARVNWGRDSLA